MAKITNLISFLLCAWYSMDLHAQDKIDTDRPDQTESATTVPKNYIQGEFGINKENTFYKNYDLFYPTALLKYGLKNFEFRLEANMHSSYEHITPNPKWTSGLDPLVIGFKAALIEEKSFFPKTSVIFQIGIPSLSSKVFRTDHLAPSLRLVLQKTIADYLGIGTNFGVEWDGFSSTPIWIYTISPGFSIGEKWYTYIEAFGSIQKNELPQHNIDGGIAYYISNDVKVDFSSGFGISTAAPKNYIALGISFRLNTQRDSRDIKK